MNTRLNTFLSLCSCVFGFGKTRKTDTTLHTKDCCSQLAQLAHYTQPETAIQTKITPKFPDVCHLFPPAELKPPLVDSLTCFPTKKTLKQLFVSPVVGVMSGRILFSPPDRFLYLTFLEEKVMESLLPPS